MDKLSVCLDVYKSNPDLSVSKPKSLAKSNNSCSVRFRQSPDSKTLFYKL